MKSYKVKIDYKAVDRDVHSYLNQPDARSIH